MSWDFSNRTAIVTGASGGIGRAVSIGLARAGAFVVAADMDRDGGEATVGQIIDSGGGAIFVQTDVTDPGAHDAYLNAARKQGGGVDIFMNNAGWQGSVAPIADYPLDVFDKVMAVNVRGVFLGLKTVLPVMTEQGHGAVVNTASLGSHVGTRNLAPYIASKHAVMGLTKTAALEVARKGVRVNAVCPGPVDTEMLREIEAGQSPEDAEQLRRKRAASIPDGRYADVDEVADLMLYLVSDNSRHITGQGIHINGGSFAI